MAAADRRPVFAPADLAVFGIPGFEERMAALRAHVRPKLLALGDAMAPRLEAATGVPWFAHTASHARRRVNPPEETWVAFGPSPRGYKRYAHLAAGIGGSGPWVRFVVKPECEGKPALAAAIADVPVPSGYQAVGEPRRLDTRSGEYAVHRGLPLHSAADDFVQALRPLLPFYAAATQARSVPAAGG